MSQETSYFINLRRKEAAVHSIIEIQCDLSKHLEEVLKIQEELKRIPTVPKHGTYNKDASDLQTLENKALQGLFTHQWTLLAGFQNKLDRTVEIILAHTEEASPDRFPFQDLEEYDPTLALSKPLIHLPLKLEPVVNIKGNEQNIVTNPSAYLPWDEEFIRRQPPRSEVDCQLGNSYATTWESHEDICAPRFLTASRSASTYEGERINKFYCVLPPPGAVNPLLPDKSLLFGKEGFPFFKKLEVNDGVYNPETRQFARVLSWEDSSCEVEVTSHFCERKDFFDSGNSHPATRTKSTWIWGSFVISLDHFDPKRRFLAYVSPYTRELSDPFSGVYDHQSSSTGWGTGKRSKTWN